MREFGVLIAVPEHLTTGAVGCILCGQVDDRMRTHFGLLVSASACEVTEDGIHFWYSGHGPHHRILVPRLKRGQSLRSTPSSSPPDAT